MGNNASVPDDYEPFWFPEAIDRREDKERKVKRIIARQVALKAEMVWRELRIVNGLKARDETLCGFPTVPPPSPVLVYDPTSEGVFPDLGPPPACFPPTAGSLATLTLQELDVLLLSYSLPCDGEVEEKRARFAAFIGVC